MRGICLEKYKYLVHATNRPRIAARPGGMNQRPADEHGRLPDLAAGHPGGRRQEAERGKGCIRDYRLCLVLERVQEPSSGMKKSMPHCEARVPERVSR